MDQDQLKYLSEERDYEIRVLANELYKKYNN
jgi:hypothetical protein